MFYIYVYMFSPYKYKSYANKGFFFPPCDAATQLGSWPPHS